MPPPGEPLPEDVEYQISRLAASAADKLLQKNVAEEKQREIMQQMQDPVIQNETKALEIKAQDAETKRIKTLGDLDNAKMDRQLDILLKIFEETAETNRAAITAQASKDGALDEKEMRMAELSAQLGDGVMGHLARLMIERNRSLTAAKKGTAE